LSGAKRALQELSNTTELDKNGDVLLTSLGGEYNEYVTKDGAKTKVYDFGDSRGFALPETVFSQATGSKPVNVKRSGILGEEDFLFKEALEGGHFRYVQFKPDSSDNTIQVGNNKLISGKIKIPKNEIERVMGTHIIGSTRSTLEELYGSVDVEYGKDGKVYYEIPVYRNLPKDSDLDYWSKVNAIEQNSPSAGGLGGSAQAKGAYPGIIESSLKQ
jgi:hypothetical protein